MKKTYKYLLLLIVGLVAYFVSTATIGYISYVLPWSPVEFLVAVAMVLVFMRLLPLKNWVLVLFALLLLFFSLGSGRVFERYLHVKNGKEAIDIPLESIQDKDQAEFYDFKNSQLLWEKAGYKKVERGGGFHYYAIPVASKAWQEGDSLKVWAWIIATQVLEDETLSAYYPEFLNYGTKLRDRTIVANVNRAIQNAAEVHNAPVLEHPLILNWGQKRDVKPFWGELKKLFLAYSIILLTLAVIGLIVEWLTPKSR